MLIQEIRIADIEIGTRHRRDHGNLSDLAGSIKSEGLLQPIGITSDRVLVFGERRLRACRDILRWETIPARIVNVSSIAAGEFHENEIRKNFTPSERVAILRSLERKPVGDQRRSQDFATVAVAAGQAGFGNRETARQAGIVVDHGIDQLREQMDKGRVGIGTAAEIAELDEDAQCRVMDAVADGEAASLRQALRQETGTPYTPRSTTPQADVQVLAPRRPRVPLITLQHGWRGAVPGVRRQFIDWLRLTDPECLRE